MWMWPPQTVESAPKPDQFRKSPSKRCPHGKVIRERRITDIQTGTAVVVEIDAPLRPRASGGEQANSGYGEKEFSFHGCRLIEAGRLSLTIVF